jgi:hypothetical protein
MSHLPALVRAARRAARLVVAPLVLALAVASAATANPLLAVGGKEVIYTASQRKSLGLNFWPDGNMGVAAGPNGQLQFYAANSTNSVRTTGTLAAPAMSKQNVGILAGGGYNYLAGGPIYDDVSTGMRFMVYHAEMHGASSQDYYTTLGLAVARDSSGTLFDDLGMILRTNITSPLYHSIDMGGGSLNVVNDYVYVHYRDYMANGASSELAVARAPLSTLISNALLRQNTAFTKYYNGAWSEPGIGGRASALETGNPWNAWSSVSYSDYLNQFVMVSAQPSQTDGGNLYLATSSDGLSWGARQAIAADPGEQFYPSLIGTGPNPQRLGQSFYVYYTDSATGAWGRWNDAQLARRLVTFDPAAPAPPSPPPATPNWGAIGGFLADYQSGAPAEGWNYLWAAGGKLGNAATYKPLKWSSMAGAYNTTGAATPAWSGGKGHVDDYLTLNNWGGHPGQPNYSVIAAYTIQPDDGAGFYRIANSSISKNDAIASSGEDGLTLGVYVNNLQIGSSATVNTNGAILNFDRELGQLAIGDTVYVAIGAGKNQNYDSFANFDFSLQRRIDVPVVAPPVVSPPVVTPPAVPPPIVVDPPIVTPPITQPPPTMAWQSIAALQSDYQPLAPATGWRYLWAANGKAGSAGKYADLKWSNVAGAYNTTGGATQVWSGGKGHVDDYLSFNLLGGHPGQPNYNLIAAYTIQAGDGAGLYRIADSSIAKADSIKSSGEDGLTLSVYVNNALIGKTLAVSTDGSVLNFDRELGNLKIGDVIYVMVGAGANQNYDSFKDFNFTIQKYAQVAATMMASLWAVPEPTAAGQLAAIAALTLCRRRRATRTCRRRSAAARAGSRL